MYSKTLATLLVFILLITPISAGSEPSSLRNNIETIFVRVEKLGSEGMNVSKIISLLNKALDIVENDGNISRAFMYVDEADRLSKKMMDELPSFVFWKQIRLYSTIAVILSIPIIVYFWGPRLFLIVWFRLRRKWRVVR